MSVPLSRRSESRLQVFKTAADLEDSLTNLCYRSFGLFSTKSPIRHRYDCYANTEIEHDMSHMIEQFKSETMALAGWLNDNIHSAKSIYPKTSGDLNTRRQFQNQALSNCESIKMKLDYIARYFNVDINMFRESIDLLNDEKKLIKKWRISDQKRFNKLL